jgi:uncharacterized damage-inducible protein DinB
MRYDFLIETYSTERIKVLSAWSMFGETDLPWRPADPQKRGRSMLEQMVHQCVSEDFWFKTMLGMDLGKKPLPEKETRLEFLNIYAARSGERLERLQQQAENWWEEQTQFFEVHRSRAWVMTRRLTHTSHHRGQLIAYLRMMGRDVYSTYGPTSDTGGLMVNHAPVVYPYDNIESLLAGECSGGTKRPLPGVPEKMTVTERPG